MEEKSANKQLRIIGISILMVVIIFGLIKFLPSSTKISKSLEPKPIEPVIAEPIKEQPQKKEVTKEEREKEFRANFEKQKNIFSDWLIKYNKKRTDFDSISDSFNKTSSQVNNGQISEIEVYRDIDELANRFANLKSEFNSMPLPTELPESQVTYLKNATSEMMIASHYRQKSMEIFLKYIDSKKNGDLNESLDLMQKSNEHLQKANANIYEMKELFNIKWED